jgi:tRNA nucleotidyltransferase (CCA-adding enzyme)
MNYFVAGGAVRDLLLGRFPRDADYVFDAAESLFIQINPEARKIQSGSHPIFLLHGQEFTPLPENMPREEAIHRDLLRRDFTINAMLLSQEGHLHLHEKALQDLQDRLIRPASSTSLADVPVRTFRAARFASTLEGFAVHEETLRQMLSMDEKSLEHVAAEQVGNETLKACRGNKPGAFLRTLCQGSCLAPWFTEFAAAANIPAGPAAYHDASVLEHTARVMDRVAEDYARNRPDADSTERALAVWMALCHDIGKTTTPADILPSHHAHDKRGEALAASLGTRLRLPALFIKAGALASRQHMKAARYTKGRPGTKVDMLLPLHAAKLLKPFARMVAADAHAPELPALLERDMARLLAVRLPEQWQGLGEKSGMRLRELRCMALLSK